MIRRLTLLAAALAATIALTAAPAAAKGKPRLVILATGGTIAGAAGSDVQAGYTSGQVGVEQLLAAVPQAKKLATLRGEERPEGRVASPADGSIFGKLRDAFKTR